MFQRACPKSDQEENELVMAYLRVLYEEKQRSHQHALPGDIKQVNNSHTCPAVPPPLSFPDFILNKERNGSYTLAVLLSISTSLVHM